jgi:hypothetical protein
MTTPKESRHILYGALVGGPDKNDGYKDERSDFKMAEVATDYNAGFTGAVAKMYSKYGGYALSNFPEPPKREDEFFVEAKTNATGDKTTEVSAVIYNKSAWPARIIKDLSFRYFVDLSEVVKEGYSSEDVQVSLKDNQGASVSALKPWDRAKNVYYVQVDLDGSQIYPGGEQHYKKEVKFQLNSPTSAWNPDNDWSYQELKNNEGMVKSAKMPVYDSEKLIFGTEPRK